jgi:hypothetical protein
LGRTDEPAGAGGGAVQAARTATVPSVTASIPGICGGMRRSIGPIRRVRQTARVTTRVSDRVAIGR